METTPKDLYIHIYIFISVPIILIFFNSENQNMTTIYYIHYIRLIYIYEEIFLLLLQIMRFT